MYQIMKQPHTITQMQFAMSFLTEIHCNGWRDVDLKFNSDKIYWTLYNILENYYMFWVPK